MAFGRKKKSDQVLDDIVVTHTPSPTVAARSEPAPNPFALVPPSKHVTIQFPEA